MTSCRLHQAQLWDYAAGGLFGLVRLRTHLHLQRCVRCQRVNTTIQSSIAAGRAFDPTDSALAVRLSGHFLGGLGRPARLDRSARSAPVGLVLGLCLAAMILGVVVGRPDPSFEVEPLAGGSREGSGERSAEAAAQAQAEASANTLNVAHPAPVLSEKPMKRSVFGDLRLIRSADCDLSIDRATGRLTFTRMSRGFAALSFVGRRSKTLTMELPKVKLEGEDARFFVELEAGEAVVAVGRGFLFVQSPGGRVRLGSGDTFRFDRAGLMTRPTRSAPAIELLADRFLDPPRDLAAVRREASDGLAVIAGAEALVREGRPALAVARYQRALSDPDPGLDPYRALFALEKARILGFQLGKTDAMRRELIQLLQTAEGEVERQAKLSLCELALKSSRCDALRCLSAITAADSAAQKETRALIGRWGLRTELGCDHKDEPLERPR